MGIDKPLLVTVGTDSPDDLVKFTDNAGNTKERLGLSRCVPYSMLDKPVVDVLEYVCDPIGNDGNPSYEGLERDVAIRFMGLISNSRQNNTGVAYAKRDGVKMSTPLIRYNDLLKDHFSQIVEQKTISLQSGPIDCKSIDLIMADDLSGGLSVVSKLNFVYK